MSSDKPIPTSVGLGGDGDEILAIEDVERAFGVVLEDCDAPNWITAGDVFRSLQRRLPNDRADPEASWPLFAETLCGSTGVDPATITPESPLLAPSLNAGDLASAIAVRWLAALALLFGLMVYGLLA